jgi:hypothetical protein
MIRGTQIASIGGKSNRGFLISAATRQSYFGQRSFIFLNFFYVFRSDLTLVCGKMIPLSFQNQPYYPQKT